MLVGMSQFRASNRAVTMGERPEMPNWLHPILLTLAAFMLALSAPAAADGTDPQVLRPLLLAPSEAKPSPVERHRATIYRFGLKRDIRQLELERASDRIPQGVRRETQSRLGVQSRLNAQRSELSRISRALGRRTR